PGPKVRSPVNSSVVPVVSLANFGPVAGPYRNAVHWEGAFPSLATCDGDGADVAGNTYPAEVITAPPTSNTNPVDVAMNAWITACTRFAASHTPAGAFQLICTGQFVGSDSGLLAESNRTVSCRGPDGHWSFATIRYGRKAGVSSGPSA